MRALKCLCISRGLSCYLESSVCVCVCGCVCVCREGKSNVIAVQQISTGALFLTAEGKGYCAAAVCRFVVRRHRDTVLFLLWRRGGKWPPTNSHFPAKYSVLGRISYVFMGRSAGFDLRWELGVHRGPEEFWRHRDTETLPVAEMWVNKREMGIRHRLLI